MEPLVKNNRTAMNSSGGSSPFLLFPDLKVVAVLPSHGNICTDVCRPKFNRPTVQLRPVDFSDGKDGSVVSEEARTGIGDGMKVSMSYNGHSQLRTQSSGDRILELVPNLNRDRVAFDAVLKEPLRFREAISALHNVVINDLTFTPRDTSGYQEWKIQQGKRESAIRQQAMHLASESVRTGKAPRASDEQQREHKSALGRYWKARSQLDLRLREENQTLWRRLMPFDPVITVADDVVFFECFSTDESSYGCLTIDREPCFANAHLATLGTTNVDYSWELYHNFQSLRTYRQTRFSIIPEGFTVQTSECPDFHEEQIELPDGWLRGFMQLQVAMALPMKKVSLSVSVMYTLMAWLKRHREKSGPRAIRFDLQDGKSPSLVLEPWNVSIESSDTIYHGASTEPVRIWGRRRLLSLARLLPLTTRVDVYLLGTGLPSFWVVQMGNMRLTLGLSGWTTNDWTRGSAMQMLLPSTEPSVSQVAAAAEMLSLSRASTLSRMATNLNCSEGNAAAVMSQLALRGQAIYDLHNGVFRWRQVLPMALSDREFGPVHPEVEAGRLLAAKGAVKVETRIEAPRGGIIITGKAENQSCEVLIDGDGLVRKGKCRCNWHFKFGVRNGPCRHLQALRDQVWMTADTESRDWYGQRVLWSR